MKWVPVKGFEGLYEVNDKGDVKVLQREVRHIAKNTRRVTTILRKEKILKPLHDSQGNVHYILTRHDGTGQLIKGHHIVAEAFLGYDRNQYKRGNLDSLIVTHINGVHSDNSLKNLEIITLREVYERRKQ